MRSVNQIPNRFLGNLKCLFVALGFVTVGETHADTLNITLQNITERSGKIMLSINNESAFNKKGEPTIQAILEPTNDEIVYSTHSLPAGVYAVKAMHDINGNDKLDKNILGMPKEPYGFSNNARGNFGPPTFADAQFTVNGDTSITMRLE